MTDDSTIAEHEQSAHDVALEALWSAPCCERLRPGQSQSRGLAKRVDLALRQPASGELIEAGDAVLRREEPVDKFGCFNVHAGYVCVSLSKSEIAGQGFFAWSREFRDGGIGVTAVRGGEAWSREFRGGGIGVTARTRQRRRYGGLDRTVRRL